LVVLRMRCTQSRLRREKRSRWLLLHPSKPTRHFASFPLVRISRLSVMPLTDDEWRRMEGMVVDRTALVASLLSFLCPTSRWMEKIRLTSKVLDISRSIAQWIGLSSAYPEGPTKNLRRSV